MPVKNRGNPREILAGQLEEYKDSDAKSNNLNSEPNEPENVELKCLHEDLLEIKEPRSVANVGQQGFPSEWNPRLAAEMQPKGLFQNFKDFFPYDLQANNGNDHAPEIKNYLEQRPSSYRQRKVPKSPVKNVLPNEPFMKITVSGK